MSPRDLVRKAREKVHLLFHLMILFLLHLLLLLLAQVFHLRCFTCTICHKQLTTGEQLYILDKDRFLCREDYDALLKVRVFVCLFVCMFMAPLPQAPPDLWPSDEEDDELPRHTSSSPPPSHSPSLPPLTADSPKLEHNNNLDLSSPLLTKIKIEEGEYGEGEGEKVGCLLLLPLLLLPFLLILCGSFVSRLPAGRVLLATY